MLNEADAEQIGLDEEEADKKEKSRRCRSREREGAFPPASCVGPGTRLFFA
jgi:hypothetical protein